MNANEIAKKVVPFWEQNVGEITDWVTKAAELGIAEGITLGLRQGSAEGQRLCGVCDMPQELDAKFLEGVAEGKKETCCAGFCGNKEAEGFICLSCVNALAERERQQFAEEILFAIEHPRQSGVETVFKIIGLCEKETAKAEEKVAVGVPFITELDICEPSEKAHHFKHDSPSEIPDCRKDEFRETEKANGKADILGGVVAVQSRDAIRNQVPTDSRNLPAADIPYYTCSCGGDIVPYEREHDTETTPPYICKNCGVTFWGDEIPRIKKE
jgi:hypothetical protein